MIDLSGLHDDMPPSSEQADAARASDTGRVAEFLTGQLALDHGALVAVVLDDGAEHLGVRLGYARGDHQQLQPSALHGALGGPSADRQLARMPPLNDELGELFASKALGTKMPPTHR